MRRTFEYKYLVAVVFIFGLFMDILDSTVVNVALPTLGEQFHAGNGTLEWVVTGYLLSLAVWVPASGWVGDRFGTKKTFIFALTMFTLGSALCGLAQSIEQLIAFRILQGVGGGMMTPVGMAMLFRAFPPEERASASAILAVPTLLAPMLGPILGGWLVDGPGWRWIFYINLPVGVAGVIVASLLLREHTEDRPGRFDPWGFILSGAGLALLLYALSRAPAEGWTSAPVLAAGLSGLLCFAALVIVELRVAEPMLDLRLFTDRMFRNATVTLFMAMAGMLGMLFLLPLYLQQLRGFSALESGLATFPQALGMGICLPMTRRLYPRVGPRRMLAAGLLIITVSSALFLLVGLETDLWWIRGLMLLRGAGMAFAMVAVQVASFATIKPRDMGRASSLFSTNRQVAGSVGVAVLATVLIDRTATHLSSAGEAAARHAALLGFHDAFLVAALLGVIGIAFAFLIRDEDAAATLRSPAGARPEPVPAD